MKYSEQTYREALASLARLRETLEERERPTLDFVAEAIAEKADRDYPSAPSPAAGKPLTQADLEKMHFERVWIDYGPDEEGERFGEDGVVLYGKLYSIDMLDGAGLEELLLDAVGHGGDTLDNPGGTCTLYRRPPEGTGRANVKEPG